MIPNKIINENNGECKICLDIDDIDNFISPCNCKGSLKYIHYKCLESSIKSVKDGTKCEICNYKYESIKKFDSIKFLKILNYYSLFIINNYLSIILSLIFFINYRILLLFHFSISFFVINKVIQYLIIDTDIQTLMKENVLSHLLYSFIYQMSEIFFNYKKDSLVKTISIALITYNLYFLFTVFFYIKFVYEVQNKFYNIIIINKV
jgi:hypothetical protein